MLQSISGDDPGDKVEAKEEEGGALSMEVDRTEEEVAQKLKRALGMEVEEEGEEEEEGEGLLTQESEPSGTMIIDACNGFNWLSRLAMLWTMGH